MPHFPKNILEALREPMENNKLVISRVQSKIEYPTSFFIHRGDESLSVWEFTRPS
ncbi:hypothetical protein HBZS_109020 [Helicobacter bizzozeronii CCUG 35545]|nr:hypothetical protein HBZS_109020 [Helicobacter bizzozeronii CCUG 35545]